jgi:WD40 repeat protein
VFPDGSQVRCATADGPCATVATDGDQLLALVWNPDGTLLHTLPGYANDISFSPDGAVLAVGGAGARVYRVADGALVAERQYKYDSF